jgi:hypothetical protein
MSNNGFVFGRKRACQVNPCFLYLAPPAGTASDASRGADMNNSHRAAAVALAAAGLAGAAAWASETITYRYDARGRLVKVERSGTVNNGVKAEYQYDRGDNRTNVNVVVPN